MQDLAEIQTQFDSTQAVALQESGEAVDGLERGFSAVRPRA